MISSGETRQRTTCPMDCPDMCPLDVSVEGGRIDGVYGVPGYEVTGGFICSKVGRFDRRVHGSDRLRHPLRRVGSKGDGPFERITWDEAVGDITERFRDIATQWGGEAILPFHYGGSNGLLSDGFLDRLYFSRLGASRLDKTICAAPSSTVAAAMYGKMPGVAYRDFPLARCIFVWGANPKASSIHLMPFLRQAKRNGAFIVAIDPRNNFSSREIDAHLAVRPGTDLPLALGMIRLWRDWGAFDEEFLNQHAVGRDALLQRAADWPLDRASAVTGVEASAIEMVAARFAEATPALIRCGWGVERNRNGGQATAAILAIPALLGKFGVRGGGYTLSNSVAIQPDLTDAMPLPPWTTRSINMTRLARVLNEPIDPPVKALFVYNCNPVATVPDQRRVVQGLRREDLFTVVFDQVHTDTASFADIVLPATTFLEHHDIRVGYGHYGVGGVRPVLPPQGEARSNAAVFAALGRAMGWTDEAFTWGPDEQVRRMTDALRKAGCDGADAGAFLQGEILPWSVNGSTPVQHRTVFPRTVDGLIHLDPPELGDTPFRFLSTEDQRQPLVLISPATGRTTNSTFGEFNLDTLTVTMHPEDAAHRSVADGDVVRVFNELGEVRCTVRVSERVRTGVVSMPKGAWRRSSQNGWTSTVLCPDHVNAVGGGACFNDARVQVERV